MNFKDLCCTLIHFAVPFSPQALWWHTAYSKASQEVHIGPDWWRTNLYGGINRITSWWTEPQTPLPIGFIRQHLHSVHEIRLDLSPRDVDTFLNPVFVPDFFLDLAGSQVRLSGGRAAFCGVSHGAVISMTMTITIMMRLLRRMMMMTTTTMMFHILRTTLPLFCPCHYREVFVIFLYSTVAIVEMTAVPVSWLPGAGCPGRPTARWRSLHRIRVGWGGVARLPCLGSNGSDVVSLCLTVTQKEVSKKPWPKDDQRWL